MLALEPEARNSARLAASAGTHPVVIRRLLGLLQRAGLVGARTGPGGGFALSRPAASIKLADVFRAVDKDGAGTPRHRPNAACPVGLAIPDVIRGIGARAERAFLSSLEAETVAGAAREVGRRIARTRATDAPAKPRAPRTQGNPAPTQRTHTQGTT